MSKYKYKKLIFIHLHFWSTMESLLIKYVI